MSSDQSTPPNWEDLVEEYYEPIYRYCYQFHANRADAEDATQQTFLKAYQSLDTLTERSALRGWLYSIARNSCLDRKRRLKRFFALLPLLHEDETVEPQLNGLSRTLLTLLQALPRKQREVFLLRHWHDFSTDEVAKLLDVSSGTVKSHLKRAIDRLRKELIQLEEIDEELPTKRVAPTSSLQRGKK